VVIDSLPQQKALPHSEESERAVLGAVLMDGRIIDELNLRPEDFYGERHEELYRTCQSLRARDIEIDLRTVQADLERRDKGDLVGGLAYLTGLDLDLPDIGRVTTYAEIVKERAGRRAAIRIAGETIRDAMAGDPLASIVGRAAHGLDALVSNDRGAGYRTIAECAIELGEHLDRPFDEVFGIKTGIPGIDSKILAMEPGQEWLIAARPGVGKTALMLQIAAREAFHRGRRVGIVSLEMSRLELMMRLAARETGVPFAKIRRRRLTGPESGAVARRLCEIQHAPLAIDDGAGQSVHEIIARARALHRRERLDLVIVDYLTLIRQTDPGPRQDLEIDLIANALAKLAKDSPMTVITLAQVGKKSEFDKRVPTLADLKDAGEAPAYGVLILHREKEEKNRSLLRPEGSITIAKNRGGELGEIKTLFHGPTMTWSEVTAEQVGRLPYGDN
jgi:replicative DNA helicase